jgi:hypothetical protein
MKNRLLSACLLMGYGGVKPEIGLELPLLPWRALVQFTAEKAEGSAWEKMKL